MCPGLILVEARHDLYVDLHHRIIDEVDRHMPIEKVWSIDEVACRLIGYERDLDYALALARRIKQGLKETLGPCIRCSIGLAPNAFLAKVATDLEKPDGLVALGRGDLPAKLTGLEPGDLPGIGRNMAARLARAGVHDVAALWALEAKQLRRIWGSIEGERFWRRLHGLDTPEPETARRSVGHSHVLAPELRDPDQARLIARRLLMKAASRLRRLDYTAAHLALGVRFEGPGRWKGRVRTMRTQDTLALLEALEGQWRAMQTATRAGRRVKKVSVSLNDLTPLAQSTPDLFETLNPGLGRSWDARQRLSHAMDAINRRHGRDTVWFGVNPDLKAPYTGTKIAFTRIPDPAEFLE